jgi:uncharacterized protein (TIGR03067 family)
MRQWLMMFVFGIGQTWTVAAMETSDALKSLAGEYSIQAIERAGKAAPADVIAAYEGVTIQGDTITLKIKGEKKVAKLKLDPNKMPPTVDLIPSDGPDQGKSLPGIYKLEKDSLTIVLGKAGQERPKDFSAVGEEETKVVLQRKGS